MTTLPTNNDPTVNTVKHLALSDPDYWPFAEQYRELSIARTSPEVESEVGRDVLAILNHQTPDRLAQLHNSNRRSTFDGGAATVPLLLAAAFLLRTHLRIKKGSGGKLEFLVEHKPADSKLVTQLLAKLAELLSR